MVLKLVPVDAPEDEPHTIRPYNIDLLYPLSDSTQKVSDSQTSHIVFRQSVMNKWNALNYRGSTSFIRNAFNAEGQRDLLFFTPVSGARRPQPQAARVGAIELMKRRPHGADIHVAGRGIFYAAEPLDALVSRLFAMGHKGRDIQDVDVFVPVATHGAARLSAREEKIKQLWQNQFVKSA